MKKKYKLNYLIAIIVPIIVTLIFLPVKASGNLSNKVFIGRINIFQYFNILSKSCVKCYNYSISWFYLILQFIGITIITIIILKIINRKEKKNER